MVEIDCEDQYIKPFLGGFRHKETDVEYHHASSQTIVEPKPPKDLSNLRSRDTQTFRVITRSCQTNREVGTQMRRSDLYLIEKSSQKKVLTPGPYFTSSGILSHKRQMAIVIQRYWRGYLARKLVDCLRYTAWLKEHHRKMQAETSKNEDEIKSRKEVLRRMEPKTRHDFETLNNELEHWRAREIKRVKNNSSLTQEQKKKLYNEILFKEVKVLQSIDKLKCKSAKEGKVERESQLLGLMAQTKKWQRSDGTIIEVDTKDTVRARGLMNLYKKLTTTPKIHNAKTIEDRLETLLYVKWTVKEFHCSLSKDIVDLIDREADMLHRGRSARSLDGLRLRLSNLFLEFTKTPEFSKEAARFQKVRPELVTPVVPAAI